MPPPNLHQLANQELCPRVLPVPMQEIQHMTGDKFKGSLISKKNHFGSNLQKKGDISLSEHFFSLCAQDSDLAPFFWRFEEKRSEI